MLFYLLSKIYLWLDGCRLMYVLFEINSINGGGFGRILRIIGELESPVTLPPTNKIMFFEVLTAVAQCVYRDRFG